jgi:Domain of unknown function (DUF1833)
MPSQFTEQASQVINAISPREGLYTLLEIHHALLAEPVRLVNDNQFFISNGKQYLPCGFEISWPDDKEKQTPTSTLSLDNVSHMMSRIMEETQGLRGAKIRMFMGIRSKANNIENERWIGIGKSSINMQTASFDLQFSDLLNKQAVSKTYRSNTAPGIF